MPRRRYEILLPLTHNDGRPVSGELFEQTREEIVAQCGGLTFSPTPLTGTWEHEGVRYKDESVLLLVDVEETPEMHEFFVRLKATLMARFQQLEIYMVSYPIERI
jgi:hypothetical protein